MFELHIEEVESGEFGLAVNGHHAGLFATEKEALEESVILIKYEITRAEEDASENTVYSVLNELAEKSL